MLSRQRTALRFAHESSRGARLPAPRMIRAKEKDPGSAFGPEAVPLATGLVPVVYWMPGPFPGPTPRPAGRTRQAFLPVPVLDRSATYP